MKHCKFFIAWMSGSDGACGEETKVHSINDLIPQYHEKNDNVTMYEYDAPEGFEWEIGAAKAFRDNWTASDSLSTVIWNDKARID